MVAASGKVAPWVRFLPFFVLVVFLVAAFLYRENLEARADIGAPAPGFTLESLDGGEVTLAQFAGKPVIINFWTTWCPACKDEMPALEAFYRRYGNELVLLGVNMRETPGLVRPFVEQYGASFPILLDRFGRVSKAYRVTGVPETWLIDADGIAVGRYIGPMTEEQLEEAARRLLGDRVVSRALGTATAMSGGRLAAAAVGGESR